MLTLYYKGKTCLLATFSTGDFPAELELFFVYFFIIFTNYFFFITRYVPTVFDNQIVEKDFRGEPILLQLWDTAGLFSSF